LEVIPYDECVCLLDDGQGPRRPPLSSAKPVPWAPGVRDHRIRIEADSVSGRRITRPGPLDNEWWRLPAR
jgi:hypothetical protein